MSIFDRIGHGVPQQQTMPDPQQAMEQMQRAVSDIQRDPRGMIRKAGYDIPESMTNPREIANYLMQSGNIPSQRLQMAQNMMARFGLK
ncbi:MAG: hypothetical protein J6S60_00620 [Oscillospiraceae bacterium]|nr:hypothetical protein [Oscillospiraceae bacterium]